MAIFTPGPAVAEVRGSVGGTTFSRNTHGAYMRFRAVPVNPNTARQSAARQTMETLQAYYRDTLTQTERNSWIDFAALTPRKNRLGFQGLNSAINMFIAINSIKLLAGEALVTTAPAVNGMAATPEFTLTGDTTNGLRITALSPALAAGDVLQWQISPPMPFSRKFFGSGFTSTVYTVGVAAPPYTLKAAAAVAIGQRYFVRARFVSAAGRIATPIQLSADVTA